MQHFKDVNGWKVPNKDSVISKQCKQFPETTYQQTILDWALENTNSFDIAVDIGANIGLHSVRLAKKFKNVFSFEPFSINFQCLTENIKTFHNIKNYQLGLGSAEALVEIQLPADSDNSGAPSIKDFTNSDRELIKEQIKIDTLDNFNLSPNLIKIDVQSYELEVLKGAYETLKKHKPILIIEVGKGKPLKDIRDYLEQFGYVMDLITNKDKGFRVK